MLFFLANGYRVVAHDRRGHGRSSQVSDGHDMDHYAADASAVAEHLDLRNAVHIGHSTGGGEVARYVAKFRRAAGPRRQGGAGQLGAAAHAQDRGAIPAARRSRCSTVSARRSPPTARSSTSMSRPGPFYGFNRPGAKISTPSSSNWWRQGMMGGAQAHYEGIKAFSETDQTDDLKAITVPTLVLQGDDDQVVPIDDAVAAPGQAGQERHAEDLSGLSRTAC